jgi:outer membrane protein OmpA-like peptidoglycan-associated protein
MDFVFSHFSCLLFAALIGWLVGWLLGRLGRSRPAESLDVESAGKWRLVEEERNRLHVENADLKTRLHSYESLTKEYSSLRAQLDKSNSELSEARTQAAERNALRGELEAALTKLSLLEQTSGNTETMRVEVQGTQQMIAGYEADLRESEETIATLRKRIGELIWLKGDLKNIVFPVDSSEITSEANDVLEEAIAVLKGLNGVQVVISGHTDNVDNEEHNHDLSQRRAEAVRNHLITHGIPSHKLIAVGCGSARPIADNATEEGRSKNRRIEFEIRRHHKQASDMER